MALEAQEPTLAVEVRVAIVVSISFSFEVD